MWAYPENRAVTDLCQLLRVNTLLRPTVTCRCEQCGRRKYRLRAEGTEQPYLDLAFDSSDHRYYARTEEAGPVNRESSQSLIDRLIYLASLEQLIPKETTLDTLKTALVAPVREQIRKLAERVHRRILSHPEEGAICEFYQAPQTSIDNLPFMFYYASGAWEVTIINSSKDAFLAHVHTTQMMTPDLVRTHDAFEIRAVLLSFAMMNDREALIPL